MIKKIWFVRNERKLLNYTCITIAGFILFYSILNIWAFADTELNDLIKINSNTDKTVFSLMVSRINFIILPIISLAVCIFLYNLSNHTKSFKGCNNEKLYSMQKQIKRDTLIGTNLFITLTFTFIQIDKLNTIKEIQGFGLTPIYIFTAIILVFYFIMIKKSLDLKQDKQEV